MIATARGFHTTVRSGVEKLVGKDLLLDLELVIGETTALVAQAGEDIVLEINDDGTIYANAFGELRRRGK